MMSDLLKFLILEKIDRQILNKFPYYLFFSIIWYVYIPLQSFSSQSVFILILIFLITTILFNYSLNNKFENFFLSLDVKSARKFITEVYSKKRPVIDDLDVRSNASLYALGLISGVSLTLSLTSSFYNILMVLNLRNEMILSIIPFLLLCIIYDFMKIDYFDESSEGKNFYLQDLMELYFVKNTITKMSTKSDIINVFFKFLYRTITPVTIVNFPKLKYDILFVYWSPKVFDYLEELMNKEQELFISYEDGVEFNIFKTDGIKSPRCEKISVLVEKSLVEVFPYIYDPDHSGKDTEIKWSLFSIFRRDNGEIKVCGYFFIHCFEVFKRKRNKKKRYREYRPISTKAIMFIFFGERSTIEFIKNEIELISVKVPKDAVSI